MRGYFKLFIWLLAMSILVTGCSLGAPLHEGSEDTPGSLQVFTTFYPLYYFSHRIAGDRATVTNVIPAGVEPHDFEPSMKQVADIHNADVFFFLGESMEPWAKKLQSELLSEGVSAVEVGEGMIVDDDPHVWLDPLLAKELAKRIFEVLAEVDGKNSDYYGENFRVLGRQFDELHEGLQTVISQSPRKDVVTSHAILGYLARRYGLNQRSIAGLSPQDEPSLKKLSELSEIVESLGIRYIFTETMASGKFSDILAEELGISTLLFNPLGVLPQEDLDGGEDYFSVMWQNIDVLEAALADQVGGENGD